MLTCQLTRRSHGMPTVHVYIMMMSSLPGSDRWVESSGIWVGPTHPDEEDMWHVWGASRRVGILLVGACRHVPSQNFTPFLIVCLSLPPLHGGIVKTQF